MRPAPPLFKRPFARINTGGCYSPFIIFLVDELKGQGGADALSGDRNQLFIVNLPAHLCP